MLWYGAEIPVIEFEVEGQELCPGVSQELVLANPKISRLNRAQDPKLHVYGSSSSSSSSSS